MMKNTFALLASTLLIVLVGLGCGIVGRVQNSVVGTENSNSNKTLTDRAVDTTVGEGKIGVPECDEVMDLLTAEANNPDDNFVIKAAKGVVINKIKETIKQSIEENKTDKAALAKDCKEAKTELEKYKAEEQKKK